MEKALYPIVLFAQVIPKIAIAPLIVVWFGNDLAPKIILAVLIAFFPVVVTGVDTKSGGVLAGRNVALISPVSPK